MTSLLDDHSALREYAQTHSPEAMALLVARHMDWVYSAALRQVRDPADAADIAQAAFILLSQKAGRLGKETHLSGWLFNVVRYQAKYVLRSRRMRQNRERAAAQRRESAEPAGWLEIAPQLDQAVASLSESDRQPVLLRFYEQLSFADVGAALRISEEAARKRVQRAVAKLRAALQSRDFSSSGENLAGMMLSGKLVQQAPLSLHAANGTSASALHLANQARRGMQLVKLKFAACLIAGVAAIGAAGQAIHLFTQAAPPPAPIQTRQPRAVSQAPAAPAPAVPAPAVSSASTVSETLGGRVVDISGQPVAGATVWAVPGSRNLGSMIVPGKLGPQTVTAADGTFLLTVTHKREAPREEYSLPILIHADGFGWAGAKLVTERALDVELPPPTYVRAVFIDNTGSPVEGLRVSVAELRSCNSDQNWLVNPPADMPGGPDRVTDQQGAAEWTDMPRNWRIKLNWADQRFAQPLLEENSADLPDGPQSPEMTIHLQPAGSITGKIFHGTTQRPAEGIHVTLSGATPTRYLVNAGSTTDSAGQYHFAQLPPGSYTLTPQEGYGLDTGRGPVEWNCAALPALQLAEGQTASEPDMVLEKGAVVSGLASDSTTGMPIAGAKVSVLSAAGSQVVTADDTGKYEAHIPPGAATVMYFWLTGYQSATAGAAGRKMTLADGQNVTMDFQLTPLAPNSGATLGKVVFADGSTAGGAELILARPDGATQTDSCDRDGQFEIPSDGEYHIRAYLGMLAAESVSSHPGQPMTLTLMPGLFQTVAGDVQDQTGRPLAGADVLASAGPGDARAAITGADGKFTFTLLWSDTDYHIQVHARGYRMRDVLDLRRNGRFDPITIRMGQRAQ